MDAIVTESARHGGCLYRVTIYPDADVPNPLDDCSEMGTILSLNRRHPNFDPAGVEYAIDRNPDAVPLSYFEHGLCRWSVAGELPATCRCPWDSVPLAGVWLPDAGTLVSARPYGCFTRRQFMRKRAREACDAYTQWCNGEVYGYEIARVGTCPRCGEERAEPVDACWGFFGLDTCQAEARAALAGLNDEAAESCYCSSTSTAEGGDAS